MRLPWHKASWSRANPNKISDISSFTTARAVPGTNRELASDHIQEHVQNFTSGAVWILKEKNSSKLPHFFQLLALYLVLFGNSFVGSQATFAAPAWERSRNFECRDRRTTKHKPIKEGQTYTSKIRCESQKCLSSTSMTSPHVFRQTTNVGKFIRVSFGEHQCSWPLAHSMHGIHRADRLQIKCERVDKEIKSYMISRFERVLPFPQM